MEKSIGATELRQQLTDVLLAIRDEQATYVVETFSRPQAALISLDEYRQFQQYRRERDAFFAWLDGAVAANAQLNRALTEEQVLDLIKQACYNTEPSAEDSRAARSA